ncbi:hypothetical protein AVDCRST_MAG81-3657 [uncultured Synechococcales cyanobacterium]|uniref:Glutamate--cysteine ligase n=1 Tax=uncultured Synechococcales cyanobacterium TaxID=1936017 RepID=A0A6J4VKU0_9CYAN|nr:hypothetical protein AVDCRST_MAG81-3657 [uncultured Synechococcales cyanobacterium]
MNVADRRIGLEQEFFLVDEAGVLSDRADEVLQRCQLIAETEGYNPACFAPEWVKGIVEINTPPAHTIKELADAYLSHLAIALEAGKVLGLKLYPLSSYPLPVMPAMRDQLWYQVQVRTVGYERFLHAGRCTGTHLHLDLPQGTIDRRVGVSYTASREARSELLNIYNLATALDAALIALSRACPFYEGKATGLAARTVFYRGGDRFGWDGVYTKLQPVGGLQPYAEDIETLVEQQFSRYYAWLEAMDQAGVERHLFQAPGGGLLKAAWNPVRLNKIGTVELRQTDSNYPEVILAIATLVYNAADRVRQENLTVTPVAGVQRFELDGNRLLVPEFHYLSGDLLSAAASEGISNAQVSGYVDSIRQFAIQEESEGQEYLQTFSQDFSHYQSTETAIRKEFSTPTGQISQEDGLRLVRESCDKLAAQLATLSDQRPVMQFSH